MFRALLTAGLILVCNFPSLSSAAEHWMNSLILGKPVVESKTKRMEIAKSLLSDMTKLDAYVPSPSPDEVKWLHEQEQSLNSLKGDAYRQRLFSLAGSPEMNKKKIKSLIKSICGALESILKPEQPLKNEMLSWAYVSWALTDSDAFNDAIRILHNTGKVDFLERYEARTRTKQRQ